LHAFKVAGGADWESGFDDIHAKLDESMADLELLLHVQVHAWRLLAIAEGGVKNIYAVLH
jgi:hypothetical protein